MDMIYFARVLSVLRGVGYTYYKKLGVQGCQMLYERILFVQLRRWHGMRRYQVNT